MAVLFPGFFLCFVCVCVCMCVCVCETKNDLKKKIQENSTRLLFSSQDGKRSGSESSLRAFLSAFSLTIEAANLGGKKVIETCVIDYSLPDT